MTNCDPNALMEAAKCFKCIPRKSQREVLIYLFCQLANSSIESPAKVTLGAPANGATKIDPSSPVVLSWVNGGGGSVTSYNVYINSVLVSSQAGTSYSASGLAWATAFTWRVDAVGPGGTTTGLDWTFNTWTPTDVAGLVLWLDATKGVSLTGSNVDTWTDQSATGAVFSYISGTRATYQATGSVSGLPQVYFPSGNGLMNSNKAITASTSWTFLHAVSVPAMAVVAPATFATILSNPASQPIQYVTGLSSGTENQGIRLHDGPKPFGQFNSYSAVSPVVSCVTRAGVGNPKFYDNSNIEITAYPLTGNLAMAAFAWGNPVTVGSYPNATFPLQGGISEGLLYDTVLSAPDQALAYAYLNSRWVAGNAQTMTNWAYRVSAALGAAPSAGTKAALAAFLGALDTAGIASSMLSVNAFVPDNLIASATPLITILGQNSQRASSWVIGGSFTAGDLSVNGLKGNGVNKWLESHFRPDRSFKSLGSCGLTIYAYENAAIVGYDAGVFGSTTGGVYWYGLALNYSGNVTFNDFSAATTVATPGLAGFYSGNRITTTDSRVFFANSANAFSQVGATNAGTAIAIPDVNTLPIFCVRASSTALFQFTNHRMSFIAMHQGLTAAQDQALYNAVQALRVALGGGYV